MEKYVLDEQKKAIYNTYLINMMKSIHKVCVTNNLSYTLIGGSMLGAVRHKGFIPWDDDLDIALPRKDYEKLLNILTEHPIKDCFLQEYRTDPHYNQPYAKLRLNNTQYIEDFTKNLQIHQGLFIDIFPLDKVNNPKSICTKYRQKLIRMLTFAVWGKEKCYMKRKGIKNIEHIVSAILDILSKKALIKIQSSLTIRETKNWNYRASLFSSNYKPDKIYFGINDFDNLVLLPFEDTELYVVPNWQEVLKRQYRNYMQYPPVDKRNSGHDVIKIELPNGVKHLNM